MDTTREPESLQICSIKEFGVRTKNSLDSRGFKTLGDLASSSDKELLSIPNFGAVCLREVIEVMKSYGLRLNRSPWKELRDVTNELDYAFLELRRLYDKWSTMAFKLINDLRKEAE